MTTAVVLQGEGGSESPPNHTAALLLAIGRRRRCTSALGTAVGLRESPSRLPSPPTMLLLGSAALCYANPGWPCFFVMMVNIFPSVH